MFQVARCRLAVCAVSVQLQTGCSGQARVGQGVHDRNHTWLGDRLEVVC